MVWDLRGALCAVRSEPEKDTHLMLGNVSCHILRKSIDKREKNPRYIEGFMRQS